MRQLEYRHEYKHAINLLDYHSLRQRLKHVAQPDPNAGPHGCYHIRSLYFDNDDDKALREKIYGLPNREKFRIRLYNGAQDFIRLEKKSKQYGLSSKLSVKLTKDQTERILCGDIAWLPHTGDALLAEFYSKLVYDRLRPKTIVDYKREPYIYAYGNVRVTFDSDIKTSVYRTKLFDLQLTMLSVDEHGTLLLEVKYDSFLPDIIRDLIQTNTRHSHAFSKYAACRIYG